MLLLTDLSTRSLFEGRRIYVPPSSNSYTKGKAIHQPGRHEERWQRELAMRKTCLTFEAWMREKGLR
jgi:hypothetical protein